MIISKRFSNQHQQGKEKESDIKTAKKNSKEISLKDQIIGKLENTTTIKKSSRSQLERENENNTTEDSTRKGSEILILDHDGENNLNPLRDDFLEKKLDGSRTEKLTSMLGFYDLDNDKIKVIFTLLNYFLEIKRSFKENLKKGIFKRYSFEQ